MLKYDWHFQVKKLVKVHKFLQKMELFCQNMSFYLCVKLNSKSRGCINQYFKISINQNAAVFFISVIVHNPHSASEHKTI